LTEWSKNDNQRDRRENRERVRKNMNIEMNRKVDKVEIVKMKCRNTEENEAIWKHLPFCLFFKFPTFEMEQKRNEH